jgi:hypothetical protein
MTASHAMVFQFVPIYLKDVARIKEDVGLAPGACRRLT